MKVNLPRELPLGLGQGQGRDWTEAPRGPTAVASGGAVWAFPCSSPGLFGRLCTGRAPLGMPCPIPPGASNSALALSQGIPPSSPPPCNSRGLPSPVPLSSSSTHSIWWHLFESLSPELAWTYLKAGLVSVSSATAESPSAGAEETRSLLWEEIQKPHWKDKSTHRHWP